MDFQFNFRDGELSEWDITHRTADKIVEFLEE